LAAYPKSTFVCAALVVIVVVVVVIIVVVVVVMARVLRIAQLPRLFTVS